jgi:glycine/D-amino acid oxidase-like deaminating enzyme
LEASNPLKLSQWFLDQSLEKGVHFHHPAKVVRIERDPGGHLQGVVIRSSTSGEEVDVQCTRILIAAGAWSPQVFKTLFPSSNFEIPISSLAGHSLVLRSPRWTKADEAEGFHAVYTTLDGFSPEIYGRMGEELYIAGLNSSTIPLPDLATEANIEDESIHQLKLMSKRLLCLDDIDDLEVVRKGLCFRPVTNKSAPILSRIEDVNLGGVRTAGGGNGGVWLAAGHGPWGISLGPGTGKIMAEMITGQKTSADVSRLGF